MGHELDRSGSGQGQVASSCECGDERKESINYKVKVKLSRYRPEQAHGDPVGQGPEFS